MNETSKSWYVATFAALTAAVSGWKLRRAKARKTNAETDEINTRSMRRIIRTLEQELSRIRHEVVQLRVQNANQADQIRDLITQRRECDEHYQKLQAEFTELKAHVQRIEVLRS